MGKRSGRWGVFSFLPPHVSNKGVLLTVEVIILLTRSLVLLALAVHLTEEYLQGP